MSMSKKEYYILGLHYNVCHNPSATILKNGELVAFAEEERFSRKKHAFNEFPVNAIHYCLNFCNIKITDVKIAIGWDVRKYPEFIKNFNSNFIKNYEPLSDFSLEWLNKNTRFNREELEKRLFSYFTELKELEQGNDIIYVPHHLAHAASTFFMSGFEESAIITADGRGEEDTIHIFYGKKNQIDDICQWEIPNSLGAFFTKFTKWFGFQPLMGEGKLMGLAAYGKENPEIEKKIDQVCRLTNNDQIFEINPEFFFRENVIDIFPKAWVEIFGTPLSSDKKKKFTQYQLDLAYSVQKRLETIVSLIVKLTISKTNSHRLCTAGGVFMNCKLNGILMDLLGYDNYFVQPLASDNGISLGAALIAYQLKNEMTYRKNRKRLTSLYLGPAYTDFEIESILQEVHLSYRRSDNIIYEIAVMIANSKIVGWFQGKMEAGARALGNRSILANPLNPDSRLILNEKVKFREIWRPFCPSVLEEDAWRYFYVNQPLPFMIINCTVRDEFLSRLKSITHFDKSARIQTVSRDANPLYYDLLTELKKITGYGIVLNTSFNIDKEPIVNTPIEAINCFLSSGMDILAIGNFIIQKEDQYD